MVSVPLGWVLHNPSAYTVGLMPTAEC